MDRTTNRRTLLAAVPGIVMLAVGVSCGDDGEDEPASTVTSAPTAEPTAPAAEPTATMPPEATVEPTATEAAASDDSSGYRLIPLPPEELGAPPIPEPAVSTAEGAVPVAVAIAYYDDFGTDDAPGAFPRVVRHAMGETTLESPPVRVVVLDSGEMDSVIQLGVKPVGALEYDPDSLPDYLLEGLTEATTVGTLAEPDLEAIVALRPDLILSSKLRHEDLYESLSAIAPTVFGDSTGVVWKQNFALHAQALGREEEAAAVVQQYEERVRAMNAALPDPRPTVSVVRVLADNLRYYQRANYSGTILTDLGFPRPESQNVDDFALLNQSVETLGQFADADVIFVSPTMGSDDAFVQDMLNGPLWGALSAVQAGKVRIVLDDVWMAGIGYQAAQQIMDDIADQFDISA